MAVAQAAQQDSFETSLVKVWAASFSPSAIVQGVRQLASEATRGRPSSGR